MILALDLGTQMGYAYIDIKGAVTSGSESFKNKRMSGGGMRYRMFETWLNCQMKPDAIYFEEVRRHAGTAAAHVYGGFKAILEKFCFENEIPYMGLPVGTIKKFATGVGNANKDAMIDAFKKATGTEPADDNEADAYFILHLALQEYENK